MEKMFSQASAFNQDLSDWNVGKVTNMVMMFSEAKSFKQKLCDEAWVNSEADKRAMFLDSGGSIVCPHFKPRNREELKAAVGVCLKLSAAGDCSTGPQGAIINWVVSQVTSMDGMFSGAKSFDQDLSKWNVGKITSMGNLFASVKFFDGGLSKWNVAKVNIMSNVCLLYTSPSPRD